MSRRGSRRDAQAGFTLVEVLVAFFIAAVMLTMALRVLGEGAGWARRGPQAALRLEEASSLMDRMLADPALVPGARDGAFADGGRWRLTVVDVTALVVSGAPARLLRLDLYGAAAQRPLFTTLATVARLPR